MIDELELVRESMSSVPAPDDATIARLRASLDALIGPPPMAAPAPPRTVRRATRRRIVVATAALAAAALATLFLLPSSPIGTQGAAASVELTNLSRVATHQRAAASPNPRQFEYIRSESANRECVVPATGHATPRSGATLAEKEAAARAALGQSHGTGTVSCALIPSHRQLWMAYNGSGRLVETTGPPIFLSAAERSAWKAAGSPTFPSPPSVVSNAVFGPGTLIDAPTNLASLPTDPSKLALRITARAIEGGPPGPAEDFTQVGDLLRETHASPSLRAALYKVAAGIPGVELLGHVTLHDGRSGVGVGYTANGIRSELVFNPSTSALVGEQQVAATANPPGYTVPAGTVLSWTEYGSSTIVDRVTDTPNGTVPIVSVPKCSLPRAAAAAGSGTLACAPTTP